MRKPKAVYTLRLRARASLYSQGDARYLCRDLLESRPSTAADIFSLGMTLLEVKSGVALPGRGPRWEALRSGGPLPALGTHDEGLSKLIHGCLRSVAGPRAEGHRTHANPARRQSMAGHSRVPTVGLHLLMLSADLLAHRRTCSPTVLTVLTLFRVPISLVLAVSNRSCAGMRLRVCCRLRRADSPACRTWPPRSHCVQVSAGRHPSVWRWPPIQRRLRPPVLLSVLEALSASHS